MFAAPKRELELIHAKRLFEAIFENGIATLTQRDENDSPDFEICCNGQKFGLEVTQPTLCTLPQAKMRRLDEILKASHTLTSPVDNQECYVNLYVDSRREGGPFSKGFEVDRFVDEVAELLREAAKSFGTPQRHIEIVLEGAHCWLEAGRTILKMEAQRFSAIPRPLHLAAFDESGAYARPVLCHGGKSWTYEDELQNRQALVKAVCKKAQKLKNAFDIDGFNELWLLVHPPRFGEMSFDAGEHNNWPADEIVSAGQGFARIFFADFSGIYEVHRSAENDIGSSITPIWSGPAKATG